MADLIKKAVRHVKRQVRESRKTARTRGLLDVGAHLLNTRDHEAVSVTEIASEAGVSVGSFYRRFASKDAFLLRVVYARLGYAAERARADLDPARWRGASAGRIVRAIVDHIIHTLNSSAVGAVRTAWKCGQLDPAYLGPLVTYRAVVADRAVALVKPHVKAKAAEFQIRSAIQIVLATTIDALFQDEGPLHAGRRLLADMLGRTLAMVAGVDGYSAEPIVPADLAYPMIATPPEHAAPITVSHLVLREGDTARPETAAQEAPKAVTRARAPAPPPRPSKRRRVKRFL